MDWHRSNSLEFPRQKIYLTSLNQLIDRKIVVQPEVQTNNKIFPQRSFAKRLSLTHQRAKSSVQIRSRKFDLHWSSKNAKNMVVESNRFGSSHQNKRENNQESENVRVTHFSQYNKRQDSLNNPILKISLTSSASLPEPYNYSPQNLKEDSQSLQLKSDMPQKNFLRKGSNLQKQIVLNLLRNKIIKQRQLNQKKQYSNQQIIKMIQVFKGVAINEQVKQKKGLAEINRELSPLGKKKRQSKELKGWEQDPLGEQDMNQEK